MSRHAIASILVLAAGLFGAFPVAVNAAETGAQVKLIKTIPLGGTGRWDYLCVDAENRRLYVPRSTHVMIVDLDKGEAVGDIPNTNGVHGVALAPEQNLGFSSNGKDNAVTVFDLKTGKVVGSIKAGSNPDAILYDPASKHVFAMNHSGGDITVIDPAAPQQALATIQVGGKLEFGQSDGAGHIFVNVEDKSEVVEVDSKANRVLAHWSTAPGDGPTGLAIDVKNHRLIAGCDGNATAVILDSETGKVIGTAKVGQGVDGAAYEPALGVAIIPNGKDGTASIIKETAPGKFEVVQTAKSVNGARTITIDEKTHHALLPCNVPDGKGGTTFGIAVLGLE